MWAELTGVTQCLRVAEKGVKDVWGVTGQGSMMAVGKCLLETSWKTEAATAPENETEDQQAELANIQDTVPVVIWSERVG